MPYTGEHSVELREPAQERVCIKRTKGSGSRKVNGRIIPKNISVLWQVDADNNLAAQSLRFPEKEWTPAQARTWLLKNSITDNLDEAVIADKERSVPCYSSYVNAEKSTLEIILHDEIGFWGTQSGEFLQLLQDNADVSIINVDINSPGGAVRDGVSIYNSLKEHKATININVSGVAASIASVIAMAGDTIKMPETAMMMIHKPLIPWISDADSRKLRTQADVLDKMETSIIKAYKTHVDSTTEELEKMLADTTWFTAEEARDAGFADEVTDEVLDAVDFFDFSAYNYGDIPATVMNRFDINRDDSLEGMSEDIDETVINKILNAVQKHFNLKKEPVTMADTKTEERLTVLEKENKDQKDKIESLTTENTGLKTKIDNQDAATDAALAADRKATYKSFCDGVVKEGKMLPADVDLHVDTMVGKFATDSSAHTDEKKDTPQLDAYKDYLNRQKVSVPVGDRQVADKKDVNPNPAPNNNVTDPLTEAARKIVKDSIVDGKPTITLSAAMTQAHQENPGVFIPETAVL